MHLELPYHSRRDELGGVINDEDWADFTKRLEGIINKVRRKRARIIKRRKRRGKKLMPRSTIFKPVKKEKLDKNPLWKEVFMQESSDDDGSDSEGEEHELFKEFLKKKGMKTEVKQKTKKDRNLNTA